MCNGRSTYYCKVISQKENVRLGFVSAAYLGPRTGRKKQQGRIVMGNAKMSMTGLFMLWWGFLAYNSAATFGVTGSQW